MAKNFLLLNYHAFVAIHTPIAVTFSTPTLVIASLWIRQLGGGSLNRGFGDESLGVL